MRRLGSIIASRKYDHPLTPERLHSWQAALFPTGYSGLFKIQVGEWRSGKDQMQVVSGGMGKEVREITDLLEKKVLIQNSSKGRSVSYDLNWLDTF